MDDPISARRLGDLVRLIYDCAIDPARWPIAMEAIRTELDCHNATLDLILLPSGKALSNVQCNIPPRYAALLEGAGPDVIEQWGGEEVARTLPLDRPAVLSRVNPAFDRETTTNGYFLAFAKPQQLIDVLAIGLARDAHAIGAVSFGRHVDAGPIGAREIAVAELLLPHLQRAATINRLLDMATAAQATFATTLDALASPILMLDAERRPVYANPAAERLLARGLVLRLADGIVEAATPEASSALVTAIKRAARDERIIDRRGLGIPISGIDGSRGALHIFPLIGDGRTPRRGVVAAVLAAEVHAPFNAPAEMAAALFDLTAAERRVFELLVTGHTPATAATTLGIVQSTVKTHLARLYDKMGVHRQSDLVRIAVSLAVPLSSDLGDGAG